jgi:cyclopropane fatty-acyl-phospholipid synthase-like methyltransferase
MAHLCHWRNAYLFDHVGRRLFQNPEKIIGEHVGAGATVLDLGCGMGFISIAAAGIVGVGGKVISVDLQQEMLDVLMKRAQKKGVAERIEAFNCTVDHIGEHENVDLAVSMWSMHEMPDQKQFVEQVASALATGGKFLIAEPRFHVTENDMKNSIEICAQAGLRLADKPRIGLSHAALLIKE